METTATVSTDLEAVTDLVLKRRRSYSGSRTRRTREKPHSGLGETGMGLLR
jgi:hypothetical protein